MHEGSPIDIFVTLQYTAASALNLDFGLFVSFDVTSLPCASTDDASAAVSSFVQPYINHPKQFRYGVRGPNSKRLHTDLDIREGPSSRRLVAPTVYGEHKAASRVGKITY